MYKPDFSKGHSAVKKGHVLIVQMKALHVVLLTLCHRLKHFFAYISVISKFYPKSNFTTVAGQQVLKPS